MVNNSVYVTVLKDGLITEDGGASGDPDSSPTWQSDSWAETTWNSAATVSVHAAAPQRRRWPRPSTASQSRLRSVRLLIECYDIITFPFSPYSQVTPNLVPDSPYQRETACHGPTVAAAVATTPRVSLDSYPRPDGEDSPDQVRQNRRGVRRDPERPAAFITACDFILSACLAGLQLAVQRGKPVVTPTTADHRRRGRRLRRRTGAGSRTFSSPPPLPRFLSSRYFLVWSVV